MVKTGRLFGTELHISPWTLVVFIGCLLAGLLEELLVWICALAAHEVGHLMLAAGLGYSFPRLDLKPYGGVMQSGNGLSMDPMARATVALAGGLGNFLLMGVCLFVAGWIPYNTRMLQLLIDINLGLALLNFLPALPLDGGHALQGYLNSLYSHRRATAITLKVGIVLAWGSAGVFALGLMAGVVWPWPVLLAGLLWQESRQERRRSSLHGMRQLLWRRQVMGKRKFHETKRIIADQTCTIGEAVGTLGSGRYYYFDVIDEAGRVLGSLSEGSIMEAFFAGMGSNTLGDLIP